MCLHDWTRRGGRLHHHLRAFKHQIGAALGRTRLTGVDPISEILRMHPQLQLVGQCAFVAGGQSPGGVFVSGVRRIGDEVADIARFALRQQTTKFSVNFQNS